MRDVEENRRGLGERRESRTGETAHVGDDGEEIVEEVALPRLTPLKGRGERGEEGPEIKAFEGEGDLVVELGGEEGVVAEALNVQGESLGGTVDREELGGHAEFLPGVRMNGRMGGKGGKVNLGITE